MSHPTYPGIYTHPDKKNDASLQTLHASVERHLKNRHPDGLTPDQQERLDAELAWIERSGATASWVGLARLAEAAQERSISLGAPLGPVEGTLIGAALLGMPDPTSRVRPIPTDAEAGDPPPGVEVPASRREELLRYVAGEGDWDTWTPRARLTGQIALWLRPSSALSTLDAAIRLAGEHPSPGFQVESVDLSTYPSLSDAATALLRKGDLAGIPYLSSEALKGYKGDFSRDSVAALVARSGLGKSKSQPSAPEGVEAWAEQTVDTGGVLLYYDQFASIMEEVAGIPAHEAAALRLAMLHPEGGPGGKIRERFMAGCLESGLDTETSERVYNSLLAAAPGLASRQVAAAWARVALWLAALKADHPAAFLAAALTAAWARQGRAGVATLAGEATRLGVALLPPHANLSLPLPALEQAEGGWGVRWGLAMLPGWDHPSAERFTAARTARGGCSTLRDLAHIVVDAELALDTAETLVRSGACDHIGRRDALLSLLPTAIEWARGGAKVDPPDGGLSEEEPSPRERYAMRSWEERHLGVGFTSAPEMGRLRASLDKSGGLRSRLITSAQIGEDQVGRSVLLVGLLHAVRLFDPPDGAKGDPLAVAQVEDLDGSIEIVAFPPNYKRHHDLWVEGNLVVVTARVLKHEVGGIFLLSEHLAAFHGGSEEHEIEVTVKVSKRVASPAPAPAEPVANGAADAPAQNGGKPGDARAGKETTPPVAGVATADSPNYRLVITLPGSDDDHADIDHMIALNRLLHAHPGPDAVMLRIPYNPETGDYTTAPLPRGVRYTASLELKIRDLLGSDALALIKLVG
jgi:hypothetical protein